MPSMMQAMYHRVDAVSGQGMVHRGGKDANADRKPVGQPLPDHMKGEVEYQQHNGKKGRERRIPAGKNRSIFIERACSRLSWHFTTDDATTLSMKV